ncbi:MAG: hypothetical protein AB7F53_09130 [Nitrososphaeraceae archaeon]
MSDGFMNDLLPVKPETKICIPVIRGDIAITNATNSNPTTGNANIKISRAISSTSTAIVKPLSMLLCSLCPILWITLGIPSDSNAKATGKSEKC